MNQYSTKRERKMLRKLVAVGLLASFGTTAVACGTLFNSGTKSISMSSEPSEAEVYVDGNRRGVTPITLELDNQSTHTVVFRKEGHEDVTCEIGTSVGAGWVILDVLGGLVPVVIDAATGKWKSLDRETCNVNLPSEGSGF